MNITHHIKHLDGIARCVTDLSQNPDRMGCLARVISRIALFLIRLVYRIITGEWYDNAKAKQIVEHFIYNTDIDLKTPDNVSKVKTLADKLQIHFDRGSIRFNFKDDSDPAYQSVEEMPFPDPKLLLHIHGNEFGANNEKLEGNSSQLTLKYLHTFLQRRRTEGLSTYGLDNNALEEIADAFNFEKQTSLTDFTQSVQDKLNTNKRVLLNGGWTGKSGHAIFYEIIPESDGKVTFRMYNLGDGSENHELRLEDYKEKASPYYDFKGVSKERLKDENVLRAIYELKTHETYPNTDQKTEYDAQDIYAGLKALLKPTSCASNKDDFMLLQRARICSWRSLMAFLRTRIGKNEYKRFILDIKLQSLLDAVKTDIFTNEAYHLIKTSYFKLCRTLEKAHRKRVIGQKYFLQAEKELRHVEHWLEKNRRLERPRFSFDREWIEPNRAITQAIPKGVPLHEQISGEAKPVSLQRCYDLVQELKGKALEVVLPRCEEVYEQGGHQEVHLAIINCVKALSLDPRETENPEEQLIAFGKLAKLFFKTCFLVPEAHHVHPERLFVLAKLFHIQRKIAMSVKKQIADLDYDIGGNVLNFDSSFHFFFRFIDPQLQEDFPKIRGESRLENLSQAFSSKWVNYLDVRESSQIIFNRNHQKELEGLAACLPDVFSNIHAQFCQEEGYRNLDQIEQSARIFTSEKTPEWFRLFRDTYLSLFYLDHEPIGRPLDEIPAFSWTFQHEELFGHHSGKPACQITFSLGSIPGKLIGAYPDVRKARNHPSNHYSGWYRPFFISKSDPQRYDTWQNNIDPERYQKSEKKFLSMELSREDRKKFSDENFEELVHLFLSDRLRIPEGFEYFYRYPEKFNDPEYQMLFEFIFFGKDLLFEEMKKEGFSHKLAIFVEQHINQALARNEVQTAVFLLRMSRLFKNFSPIPTDFQEILPILHRISAREGLELEEKSIVYAEIAAALSKKATLNREEVKDLLISIAFLTVHPVPEKWRSPETDKEVREAVYLHSHTVRDHLDPEIAQSVFQALHPMVPPKEWNKIEQEGEFPHFQSVDKTCEYYPLTGQLFYRNTEVTLPLDIRKHAHFRQIFESDIDKAIVLKSGIYELRDAHGNRTLLQFRDDTLVMEQERKGQWYRFIPQEIFTIDDSREKKPCYPSSLISRHLQQNFNHWHPLDDTSKIELIDPENDTKRYEVTLNQNHISVIREMASNLRLSNPSQTFTHFESSHYIQEWYDDSGLSKVEFSRFDLTFTSQDDKMMCQQVPGYFLVHKQPIPLLGSYSNYLVLENDEGRRKVLLPQQKFKPDPKKRESLLPLFHIDRQDSLEHNAPQKALIFDVEAEGTLSIKGREANLYLTSVLSVMHEYEAAVRYLKKYGAKLTPYTQREREALNTIATIGKLTGDASGNGLALQLVASYMLTKNSLDHNLATDEAFDRTTMSIYKQYLGHYAHATAIRLEKEGELFLLKRFLAIEFNVILFMRLQELDPEYAKSYTRPQEQETAPSEAVLNNSPKSLIRILMANLFQRLKSIFSTQPPSDQSQPSFTKLFAGKPLSLEREEIPLNNLLITRINFYLAYYPLTFYQMARSGSSETKRFLQNALSFGKQVEGKDYARLFELILANSDQFSDAPSSSATKKTVTAWWKANVLQKADELLPKGMPQPKPERAHSTPEDFKLDPELSLMPSITLNYTMEQSPEWQAAHLFERTEIREQNGHELQQWIDREINEPMSDEPLYKRELERLQQNLTTHQKNATHTKYTLTDSSAVERLLKEGKTDLKPLEKELLEQANRLPEDYTEQIRRRLLLNGRAQRVITLEDLFVSFARQDPDSLIRTNPILNEEDINALYSQVGNYLLLATHEQQRKRAENALGKLGSNDVEQELATTLLAKRHYDPQKRPAYLVFEYYADILMREKQVEKLELFLKNGDQNPVLEMIMGSGKSKVLLPLLGLLRADGEKISTLIVPSSLFESVSSDTQKILSEAFSQSLRALHFDRNTLFTVESLRVIRDDLLSIIRNKECLIMTSKSMQCLILKFIEQAMQKQWDSEIFKLMQEILALLSKGQPIIDEADTVLNVLHEVSFSTGEKRSPDSNEIQVVSQIFKVLYTDPEIKEYARLESDPRPNLNSPVLTEPLYHERVRPLLAQKWAESMQTVVFESAELTQKVQTFFKDADKKQVTAYLCHDPRAQRFYDAQDSEIQNILALAGEQISNFLPHTLTRTCEEKYGLDGEGVIAIPFAAANTPNSGSLFANHYITMNYTFQYYSKKGVSEKIVIQELNRLQAAAIKELQEGNIGATLESTEAWKLFMKLKGDLDIPLFNYKESHLAQLVSAINASEEQVQLFVSKLILPQLDLFTHKLSCNAHNLIAFFNNATGFTGTLWNSASMHSKLAPEPEPGTDAQTLHILWEHSYDKITIIKESPPEAMIKQLENERYDMISDAGGYFKEGGNIAIARMMSQRKGRPVVFYDSHNQQAIIDGQKETLLSDSPIPIEDRDTFLDQRHTTGADVPQKRDAVGLVTIGRTMLLRDLLQSVWRLRGLAKSQRAHFVISEEVKAIICQTLGETPEEITFEHILRFCIINQVQQQGKDNFKALRQELMSLTQELLFNCLMSNNQQPQDEVSQIIKEEWIKLALKEPQELFGTISAMEERDKALKEELQRCKDYINNIFKQLPFLIGKEERIQRVHTIAKRLAEQLPARILVPLRPLDDDQTVEIEQEQQQKTQTQLEVQEQPRTDLVQLGRSYYLTYKMKYQKVTEIDSGIFQDIDYDEPLPYFELRHVLEQDPELKEYAALFENIYLTLNVPEWPEYDPKVSDLKLLGAQRTPLHFVTFVDDDLVILNHTNAMYESGDKLYNIYFGYNDESKTVSPETVEKIAKIKFLNGESSYSKQELKYLERWMKTHGKEKLLRFFQRILQGYPDKAARYASSNLKTLFGKVQ